MSFGEEVFKILQRYIDTNVENEIRLEVISKLFNFILLDGTKDLFKNFFMVVGQLNRRKYFREDEVPLSDFVPRYESSLLKVEEWCRFLAENMMESGFWRAALIELYWDAIVHGSIDRIKLVDKILEEKKESLALSCDWQCGKCWRCGLGDDDFKLCALRRADKEEQPEIVRYFLRKYPEYSLFAKSIMKYNNYFT